MLTGGSHVTDTLSDLGKTELSHRRLRILKDRLFGFTMAFGGVAVIAAILTIFFYLLYVVWPLFRSVDITPINTAEVAATSVAQLVLNEYADTAFVLAPNGSYEFFDPRDGRALKHGKLVPERQALQKTFGSNHGSRTFALALNGGKAIIARAVFNAEFTNSKRETHPDIHYPLGPDPVTVVPPGAVISNLAVEGDEQAATSIALTTNNELYLTHFAQSASLLDDTPHVESTRVEIATSAHDIEFMLLDIDQNELYLINHDGLLSFYDIRNKDAPKLLEELQVVQPGARVTAAEFLSGGISLLIGDDRGRITQWFPIRDEQNNYRLKPIRSFRDLTQPIRAIAPEYARKSFVAIDASGTVGLFHTTADRTLVIKPNLAREPLALALAAPGNALAIIGADHQAGLFAVANPHPEVSWHALWGKVHYEGRAQPEYIWQSSSASSDFEPKFSLTPLTFGTLKAALYALLFAIPVAILGAVYTAYFMQPRLRTFIKPSIEIMAALPTVILGFLAGLWLAPLIETHLIGVLSLIVALPFALLLTAWLWSRLPGALRHQVPEGMEAVLLIPVVCAVIWLAMSVSQPLEQAWFAGNLPRWLTHEFGITYDQRNSLVVGIAMGFAIIPNIYSISEDALFAVPKQLSTGSLALGATPWQTVTRVVLLTASPGIFSAVMIGLGRAVGETMIVLMSTGNTPIMDLNMFQGFRALSANIAVEMPESALNSTHYRVLFLAALVLFAVTFLFNTVAEIVRQRLRTKYGNL